MRITSSLVLVLLLSASPVFAGRIDVSDTTGFGLLTTTNTSVFGPPNAGTFNVTVQSQVYQGAVYTYVYQLSLPTSAAPVNLLSVLGVWSGANLLSWGQVNGSTTAGVALFGNPSFGGNMKATISNTTASAGGGLSGAEILTFYVQSLYSPLLQTATAHDTGFAEGLAYSPTPEPGTLALIGAGLIGLYGAVRRRQLT